MCTLNLNMPSKCIHCQMSFLVTVIPVNAETESPSVLFNLSGSIMAAQFLSDVSDQNAMFS